MLGHHLTDLVGPHTLLWHHLADGVRAGFHPLFRHHLADLIALLLNDGLTLVANAIHLLFTHRGNPLLFRDAPRRALLLGLYHFAWRVASLARARIAHPATWLTYATGDHRARNLAGFRFPVAAANLDHLREVNWLAHRLADVTLASLHHLLAYGVGNLLRASLLHWLANRIALLPLLVDGLAHRVGDLLRARLVDRLAHRVGLLAGFIDGLAHRVGDLLRARLVDRLAHRVGLLAGFIDGLAHRVGDLLRARLIDRLTDRAANLTGASFVDGLAHRVDLLASLIHRLAHRVGDLLRHRLPHRLADGAMDLAGLRLVHGLHDRVGNLFRDRFPHRLTDGVVDGPRTGFPHRLANGVLDILERLFGLVADAINLLLFNDSFTNRLVAGVLLLLVHDILHHASTATRCLGGTARLTGGRLTTRTTCTGTCKTDCRQLGSTVFIAGNSTVGGIGARHR